MPNLKDLRKRISSVRSTQQITRAMKMVAAARLRRAQEAAERARPYAEKLTEMFTAVVSDLEEGAHPLLARRDEKRIDVLVITSDRGLCGGYNSNLLRLTEGFLAKHRDQELTLSLCGRKGVEYFKRRGNTPLTERTGVMTSPIAEVAGALAQTLTERFANGETDAVYLVYSKFRSAIAQVPTITPLLPVAPPTAAVAPVEYIFEPPRAELLSTLLPRYIQALLLQALLESIASEHGARMTAMENATTNASDMIQRLTLSMNRARQSIITTELMEIVSGAEALKG
ncbi:MAG TPA: ATP synthase F1 subunit gamma [Candidatus Binatia bacterium]|jgi:F-type H+-transporting ATPase subunit gamma|nr:ATP synthase F1 subunit gamma [Candidatus Binatia bacterium]